MSTNLDWLIECDHEVNRLGPKKSASQREEEQLLLGNNPLTIAGPGASCKWPDAYTMWGGGLFL